MDRNQIISTVIVAIIVLIIYYFGTMKRRKDDKDLKEMQDNLKIGDKIITFSGLKGEITEVNECSVIIMTQPDNVKLSIEKWAVAGFEEEKNK